MLLIENILNIYIESTKIMIHLRDKIHNLSIFTTKTIWLRNSNIYKSNTNYKNI